MRVEGLGFRGLEFRVFCLDIGQVPACQLSMLGSSWLWPDDHRLSGLGLRLKWVTVFGCFGV